jgi:hypothetical protein
MTFKQFLYKYKYNPEVIEWADGKSLQSFWENCDSHNWLIDLLLDLDFETQTFKELIIMFAESVTHLMQDERSKEAVFNLRRHFNGEQVDLQVIKNLSASVDISSYNLFAFAQKVAYKAANYFCAEKFDPDAVPYDENYYSAKAAKQLACASYAAAHHHIRHKCADRNYSAVDIIRNHIQFERVAQAARQKGIDC